MGKQISSPSSFLLFSCSIRKKRKEQVRKDKGWKTGREGETRAEAGREGKRARGGGGGRMGVKEKQVWAVLSGPIQCVLIFSCWFSLYCSCTLLHRTAGSSHLLTSQTLLKKMFVIWPPALTKFHSNGNQLWRGRQMKGEDAVQRATLKPR